MESFAEQLSPLQVNQAWPLEDGHMEPPMAPRKRTDMRFTMKRMLEANRALNSLFPTEICEKIMDKADFPTPKRLCF
jgi:hypothetical protein